MDRRERYHAWYEKNKEHILSMKRARYTADVARINAQRRDRYAKDSSRILEAQRASRAVCPVCECSLGKAYLPRHVQLKH